TPDGGYLAVGQSENTGAGANDILLVKVNADGLVDGCCKKTLPVSVSEYNPPLANTGFNEQFFYPPIDAFPEMVSYTPQTTDYCGAAQPVLHDTIALCPGEPYDFEGTIFYAPDEATTLLPGPGCDTVLITHFVLRQYVVSDFGVQLFCPGGFVTINGVVYDQPGTIMDTLTNHNGQFCDTIGIYTIVELPQVTLSDTLTYCSSDTIYYHGLTFAYPDLGLILDTIPNTTGGCDTLVRVFVAWSPQDYTVSLDSVVCVNGNPVIQYRVCNNGVSSFPPDNLFVAFYGANPLETTATPLGVFLANPASGECVSLTTSALPYSIASGGTIYAVVNDNGMTPTPYSLDDFPLTLISECYYNNNFDSILIKPAPFVPLDLGPDLTLCVDSTVVFDAGAGYVSYLWQDGSTDATFAAEDVGVYWVEVTDACGFVQRDSVFLTFSVLPDIKIPDQSICPGSAFHLALPGYDSYAWAPATGLSCTDCAEVDIQPDVTSSYTIAAFSNLGCSFFDTFTVAILPQIVLKDTVSFCIGDSVLINGQVFTESGIAFDTLPGISGACDTLVELTLLAEPLDLTLTLTEVVCKNGGPVVYFDLCNLNGADLPQIWIGFYTQNPFETSGGASPVFISTTASSDSCQIHLSTPVLPQAFLNTSVIYAVVNDDGSAYPGPYTLASFPIYGPTECNYSNNLSSIAVPSITSPTLDLGPDVVLCKDSTVVFNAGAGYISYVWQDGSSASTYAAEDVGVYWVEVTDECGRKQRDSVFLTFSLLPDIKFPDQELCAGQSTTISLVGYDTYEWAPATGLSCTDCGEVVVQPAATTTYTVSAFSSLGCTFNDTIVVTVLSLPTRDEVIEFCKGDQVVLNGQVYTEPAVVTDTLPSSTGGCDTLVTYHIQYLVPAATVSLTLNCPDDIVEQLDAGDNSSVVHFVPADAASDCPCPGIALSQTSGLASGSNFPVGTTQVCYTAADSCGNTASCCFNVSLNPAEAPCDVKVIGCMKYELLGISKDAGQNRTYLIRVTNNCSNKLVYTAIQLPDGVVAIDPLNASTYTSPAGRNYVVRNPNTSPFHSIRFKPAGDGIANGASDIFEYTLPAQSDPTFIHITSRVETQTFYEAHLNTFGCPVTTQSNTNRPVTDRGLSRSAYAGLSVFPNPLSGSDLFADLSDWSGQTVQIRVMDARGILVLDQAVDADELTPIHLPEGLASGIFLLEVLPPDGNRQTARFVVSKP
ncbi:MAG TPA: HYR domain-containing protein, partial [Saprospiraceae bacterium]|nr:HYR domain-containing protein [Saprospiraceae bacterium]